MSADSWDICPRCVARAYEEFDKASAAAYEQYGKVPPEEFDRLRAELKPVDPEKLRTFCEDYEFYGASEGELHVRYSGGCTECGLSLDFSADKPFWSKETDNA